MKLLYPGYDVLAKRDSLSWDAPTRAVIDARLALANYQPCVFNPHQWRTVEALGARIVPPPPGRAPVPLAAMLDVKLAGRRGDGYRDARLPPRREAWTLGLAALTAEAEARHGRPFAELPAEAQDALLAAMQAGTLAHPAWGALDPALFFAQRVLHDIADAYYSHPSAWSEIGFGGPANPRGYVRLGANARDPWEAPEADRRVH